MERESHSVQMIPRTLIPKGDGDEDSPNGDGDEDSPKGGNDEDSPKGDDDAPKGDEDSPKDDDDEPNMNVFIALSKRVRIPGRDTLMIFFLWHMVQISCTCWRGSLTPPLSETPALLKKSILFFLRKLTTVFFSVSRLQSRK